MIDPILSNPENRLFGSAAGDLGMYGVQGDLGFSVHEARADAAAIDSAEHLTATTEPGDDIDLSAQSIAQPAFAEANSHVAPGSATPAAQTFLIAPAAPEFAPQPIGFSEAAGLVQSAAVPMAPGSGGPLAELPTSFAPASAPASTDPLAEAPLAGTASSLLDALASSGASSAGLVESVLSPVSETVGGVLAGTLGLVDDTLDGLAGADPLAGVETLVTMVANSDVFDLTPVVAPLFELAGDAGLGVVDTLVGEDSLPDQLLGGLHEAATLPGLDHHDNPLGL